MFGFIILWHTRKHRNEVTTRYNFIVRNRRGQMIDFFLLVSPTIFDTNCLFSNKLFCRWIARIATAGYGVNAQPLLERTFESVKFLVMFHTCPPVDSFHPATVHTCNPWVASGAAVIPAVNLDPVCACWKGSKPFGVIHSQSQVDKNIKFLKMGAERSINYKSLRGLLDLKYKMFGFIFPSLWLVWQKLGWPTFPHPARLY